MVDLFAIFHVGDSDDKKLNRDLIVNFVHLYYQRSRSYVTIIKYVDFELSSHDLEFLILYFYWNVLITFIFKKTDK